MKVLKMIIYIIIGLIITGLFVLTFFTSRQADQENNDKSLDRMVKLKRTLIASFGQYWAINLTMYLILICIIFALLFLYTSVDKLNITISDHNGRMIYWAGITLSVIFSILIIGSAFILYINGQSNYYVPNTIQSHDNDSSIQKRIIITKIVVSIIVIISIILSVFLYIKK